MFYFTANNKQTEISTLETRRKQSLVPWKSTFLLEIINSKLNRVVFKFDLIIRYGHVQNYARNVFEKHYVIKTVK